MLDINSELETLNELTRVLLDARNFALRLQNAMNLYLVDLALMQAGKDIAGLLSHEEDAHPFASSSTGNSAKGHN